MINEDKMTNIGAMKNSFNNSVFIYRAVGSNNIFDLSIERYTDKNLTECSTFSGLCASLDTIENLMLEICSGDLEPCHLKDIIHDMD